MEDQALVGEIKSLLKTYQPSSATKQILSQAKIVLLVGATGAGRNRIINELLKTEQFYYIVSHTTRPPRINNGVMEQDGVVYNFISNQQLLDMLKNGEFVECKFIHKQQFSGTSVAEIEKASSHHKIAITDLEPMGVDEYIQLKPDTMAVFVLPPSYKQWLERLQKRGKIETAELKRRLESAKVEIAAALDKDYYRFVINDKLEDAVSVVHQLAVDGKQPPNQAQAKALARELLAKVEDFLKKN